MNTNNDNNNFLKVLEPYCKSKDYKGPLTHTSVGAPFLKCVIPSEKYDDFLNAYIESYSSENEGFHLVERAPEISQLVIDIDFDQKDNKRQYTNKDIIDMIEITNNIIRKYYKITKNAQILAFVFEKKYPSKKPNGSYKDGFHIVYPNIPMRTNMRYLILAELTEALIEGGSMKHINYINDFKNVIDRSIVQSNGWMMHGACKQGGQIYNLTGIYNKKLVNIKSNERSEFSYLVKKVANRKFETYDEHEMVDDLDEEELEQKITKVINKPIKTVKKIQNVEKQDNDEEDDRDEVPIEEPIKKNYKGESVTKYSDTILAGKLCDLLSDDRASNYNSWTQVGWALYNTSPKLLKDFLKFSRRTKTGNYNESACKKFWKDPKREHGKLTIKSLHAWAREDNPAGYTELLNDNISEIVKDAEQGTETDISEILYQLYGHCFVCIDIKNNKWYEFQDNLWVEIPEGYTLYKIITEELPKVFYGLQQTFLKIILNQETKGKDRDSAMKRNEEIHKLIKKFGCTTFKEKIMKESRYKFFDKEFEEKLDSDLYKIGFSNGVFDLKSGEFRRGLPEDYVSMSAGYNYPINKYNKNSPEVLWVEKFFKQVQPADDMNTYLKRLLASYLDGSINETFVIWTGKGANGKSKTVEFFSKALGDYCGVLPASLITGNRPPAGQATPMLADMKGRRLGTFQEPEKTDEIKVGYMKELTGGDVIKTRKLYGNPFEYKPQFKLLLTCNKLPHIDADDGGTWRRLRVTPFNSHFVKVDKKKSQDGEYLHKGKQLKSNEFPRDEKLSENMILYRDAFIWLLTQVYYPDYIANGLYEPETVLEYTKKYQKDNDTISDFLTSMYDLTGNLNDSEQLSNVYTVYKTWFKNFNTGKSLPLTAITRYIEDNYTDIKYDSKKKKIYGIKYKEEDIGEIIIPN